jgi:hypothetical protein
MTLEFEVVPEGQRECVKNQLQDSGRWQPDASSASIQCGQKRYRAACGSQRMPAFNVAKSVTEPLAGSDGMLALNFLECCGVKHTGAIFKRTPQAPLTCKSGRGQSGARPRSSCKATQLRYPKHRCNASLSLSLPPTQLLHCFRQLL